MNLSQENKGQIISTPLADHSVKDKLFSFFKVLGIIQVVNALFVFLSLAWLISSANAGVSGTEFLALYLIPFQLAGVVIAIVNLFGLVIYYLVRRPRNKRLIGFLISFLISLSIVVYIVNGATQTDTITESDSSQSSESADAELPVNTGLRFQPMEFHIEGSIEFLSKCYVQEMRIVDFAKTGGIASNENPYNVESGIVLIKDDQLANPHRINVTKSKAAELLPYAKTAQQNCPNFIISPPL